jgi:hypothetical protein
MEEVEKTQLTERQKEMLELLIELSEAAGDLRRQIDLMDDMLQDAHNKGMIAGAILVEQGRAEWIPRPARGKRAWHEDPYVMG